VQPPPSPWRALALLGAPSARDGARLVVYAALPTVGLVGGPSYADIVFAAGAFCLFHQFAFAAAAPRADPRWLALAIAFAVLGAASALWSLAPWTSLDAALEIVAIFAGSLAFLALQAAPAPAVRDPRLLFSVLFWAILAGALVFGADRETGYHLQAALTHRALIDAPTKYNRGIDYLVILCWPALGFFRCRRRWARAALLALIVGLVAAFGASLAGKTAALAGLVVFGATLLLPRLIGPTMQACIAVAALTWPFVLRALAIERAAVTGLLKPSAMHRLEIWDYMSGAVLRRPLLGWGLGSAHLVPVPAADLARFHYVHGPGMYPHDQWLQLWVETGFVGAAIGVVFALLLVRAVWLLAPPLRPFAYAAITAGLAVSAVNFEITTDSWWAAIAATGFLFLVLRRSPEAGAIQESASAQARAVVNPHN